MTLSKNGRSVFDSWHRGPFVPTLRIQRGAKGSLDDALAVLERIRSSINDDELSAVIDWLEGELRQYGYVSFY